MTVELEPWNQNCEETMPAGAGNLHLSYSTPETFGTGETQAGGGGLPSMNTPWNQDWEDTIPAGAGNVQLNYPTPETFETGETHAGGGGLPSTNTPWNQSWEETLPAGAGNLHLSYSTPKTFGTGETQVAGGGLPSMNMPWNQDWEGTMPAGAANVNLSYSTPETCGTGETQAGGARLPSMNTSQIFDYLPPIHEADRLTGYGNVSTNYLPPTTNYGARTMQDIQPMDTPCTSGPPPPFISDLNNHLGSTSAICNHAPWPIGPPEPIPSPFPTAPPLPQAEINHAGSVEFHRCSSTFNTFGIGQTQRGDLGLSPTYTTQPCYHSSKFHQEETLHYLPLRISPPRPAVSPLGFRTDASGSASITLLEPPESSPLEVVRFTYHRVLAPGKRLFRQEGDLLCCTHIEDGKGCEKTWTLTDTKNIHAHWISHSKDKPFQCQVPIDSEIKCNIVFSRKNDLKNHVANPNIHNRLEWNEEYCLILPLVDELMEIEIENFRPQETSQKSPISTKRNRDSEPTKPRSKKRRK
ncbi:hypothetical protein PCANC_08111 [Puccinia coronata f. sp. avenae]|uniref:C2H2-type domain-containing protein n=1 Tax=Puccinia coronata f. sp. avenae TaxID=200324 RepID=A0A2N5V3P1_9BASI|nr:hypothetical protein PCANC_08111 [Puccinia coronata f. sp. avenae]